MGDGEALPDAMTKHRRHFGADRSDVMPRSCPMWLRHRTVAASSRDAPAQTAVHLQAAVARHGRRQSYGLGDHPGRAGHHRPVKAASDHPRS